MNSTLRMLLLLVLVLLVFGLLPAWPYSTDWGFYPSGGVLVLVIVLVVLLFTGRGNPKLK